MSGTERKSLITNWSSKFDALAGFENHKYTCLQWQHNFKQSGTFPTAKVTSLEHIIHSSPFACVHTVEESVREVWAKIKQPFTSKWILSIVKQITCSTCRNAEFLKLPALTYLHTSNHYKTNWQMPIHQLITQSCQQMLQE